MKPCGDWDHRVRKRSRSLWNGCESRWPIDGYSAGRESLSVAWMLHMQPRGHPGGRKRLTKSLSKREVISESRTIALFRGGGDVAYTTQVRLLNLRAALNAGSDDSV